MNANFIKYKILYIQYSKLHETGGLLYNETKHKINDFIYYRRCRHLRQPGTSRVQV